MPESHEFTHLRSRCQTIQMKFVKPQAMGEEEDPLGFMPDTDKLAAYRLLVHAEIEEYLEAKANKNLASLERSICAAPSVRAMLNIYPLASLFDVSLPFTNPFDRVSFESQAKLAISKARKAIKENNGIKSQTLRHVAAITGKLPDEIDTTLSSALDSYGKGRGDVAHKSVARVTNISSPSTEVSEVEALLALLKDFFEEGD